MIVRDYPEERESTAVRKPFSPGIEAVTRSVQHSPFGHADGDNEEAREDKAWKRLHDDERNEDVLAVEAPVEVKLAHCAYRLVLARVLLVYGME